MRVKTVVETKLAPREASTPPTATSLQRRGALGAAPSDILRAIYIAHRDPAEDHRHAKSNLPLSPHHPLKSGVKQHPKKNSGNRDTTPRSILPSSCNSVGMPPAGRGSSPSTGHPTQKQSSDRNEVCPRWTHLKSPVWPARSLLSPSRATIRFSKSRWPSPRAGERTEKKSDVEASAHAAMVAFPSPTWE